MCMLQRLFSETSYVEEEFVDVALDLCRYEFEELVVESMILLHRYHSSHEDLFENGRKTQVHSLSLPPGL